MKQNGVETIKLPQKAIPESLPPRSLAQVIQLTKDDVYRAADGILKTVRDCLIAGQRLNELKKITPHGRFEDRRAELFPDIAARTLQDWQRASETILVGLPSVSISVADILRSDDESLSGDALSFKCAWDERVGTNSVRQILSHAALGDSTATIRALNGKLKGGTNKHDDRKDFPLFGTQSLKVLSGHISHWDNLDEIQKTDIKKAFISAITGTSVTLNRSISRTFPFDSPWPAELCKAISDAIKKTHKIH
jgi:hypothetical protein